MKKKSRDDERIIYIRTKTGFPVSFKLNEFASMILKKHQASLDSKFIFNIANTETPNQIYLKNRTKRVLAHYVNQPLREIMADLNINKHITYYCARHSFATVLNIHRDHPRSFGTEGYKI